MSTGGTMAIERESVRLRADAMDWARKAAPWEEKTISDFISDAVIAHAKNVMRNVASRIADDDEKPRKGRG